MSAKQYYILSIDGIRMRVRYIRDDSEFEIPQEDDRLAIAWVEEKDRRTHYFLFLIGGISYVLLATHGNLNGLKNTLIKVQGRTVTRNNFRNVGRWKNDCERIPGNEANHIDEYSKRIPKTEGIDLGHKVDIHLKVDKLTPEQIGDTIENPIVVEDVDE